MRRRTPYKAGDFAFSNEKMMEKAVKEEEGIAYMKRHLDMSDPESVLGIYKQMVEQQLFETPVGYVFLYELQEFLKTSTSIEEEYIPAIPVVAPEIAEIGKEKKATERSKDRTVTKTKVQHLNFKTRFQASFYINVLLVIIVIAMFAITATSGNINIVNYENALIEKYEMWETELKDREQKLQEREAELSRQISEQMETVYPESSGIIQLEQ